MSQPTTGQRKAAAGAKARAIDLKDIGRGQRALDVDFVPSSYDAAAHTVDLVLTTGAAVERWFGTEVLSVEEGAVEIGRLKTSGIPFLDGHRTSGMDSVLGRMVEISFVEGQILGRAKFAQTEAGQKAEGMMSRGELTGISIGYSIETWEIRDADGNVLDPVTQNVWAFDNLTFTASRWELLEVSLVSIPADPAAMARSHDDASEQDLRATPMGKGAKEITVTRGDASVTYRYGALAPHERAWPVSQKGNEEMANRTNAAPNAPAAKDEVTARSTGKGAEQGARKKRDEKPTIDDDGYYVDADGNYCDANGKAVDEPMKAERDEPTVDDDGYYVDGEGNYVDADGNASDEPVKAERDAEDDNADAGDDDRKGRGITAQGRRSGRRSLTVTQAAEMTRIGDQARAQGVVLNVASYIERGISPMALRKIAFDKLAERSKEQSVRGSSTRIEVQRDEAEGKRDAMELALVSRVLASRGGQSIDYAPKNKAAKRWAEQHAERAQEFMGRGFVEIAAECLGHRGNIRTSRAAIDIIERAFQSTSDFPAIFQNVLNKSLLARYELADPTYKQISIERSFNDFRPHPMVRAGEFPMLQPVTESGEIKAGKSADTGENISLVPYAVQFPITRQMIVNDELGAIDQILGSSGDAVRLFENVTFFQMFNANPVLNQDGTAVFAAGHNNLAAAAGVISVTDIGAGRAALRAMRSVSGYLLNVPPRIILTGPTQETAADQIVADITPQLTTSVNPFSGKLKSVSDANIADNSWYLIADPNQLPCFVHGFLNGSDGPRVRTYEPFGVQGVKISLEHDFAVGAIDYRGAFKNPGALPQ